MKEHKFSDQSFIRGYYINPKICDDIIKCFNELPESYRKPGEMYNANSKTVVNPESKDSIDFMINNLQQQKLYKTLKLRRVIIMSLA